MQRLRFIQPVKTAFNADPRHSPRLLHNAYLDRKEGTVIAANQHTDGSALDPGQEPFIVWNGYLLSGQDNVRTGDTFNRLLYTSPPLGAAGSAGIQVYPPNYDGTNDETEPPHIDTISVSQADVSGRTAEQITNIDGCVSYAFIPFNARGEAGPWAFFGTSFTYEFRSKDVVVDGERSFVNIPKRQHPTFTVGCSEETSYIQIFRTTEFLQSDGDSNTGILYYLGRFQVDGGGAKVFDDKSWWDEGYYARLLNLYAKPESTEETKAKTDTFEELAETGVLDLEKYVLPSRTLDRTINMHAQGVSSVAGTDNGVTMNAPRSPRATSMLNHAGIMMYGDVRWPTKTPAVLSFVPGTDSVTLQYEYVIPDGKIYGPTLSVTGIEKVNVAWQGEQALLVYKNGSLFERLVKDSSGRYVTKHKTLFTESFWECPEGYTFRYVREGTGLGFDVYKAMCVLDSDPENESEWIFATQTPGAEYDKATLWTHDALAQGSAVGGSVQPSSQWVSEPNVILLGAQDRPLEVTTDQFYTPDRERVRGIFPARLAEEEGLRAYDFYVGTSEHIFAYRLDNENRTALPVESLPFGIKENGFNDAIYQVVKGGVCVVGTDERLYLLSGRRYHEMDKDCLGLWTEIWDLGYRADQEKLYIATDTGIWVWDFDYFGGIYKHLSLSGATQTNLAEVVSTIGGTAYDHMVAYDETQGAFLLEDGSQATDAALMTQELSKFEQEGRIEGVQVAYDKDTYDAGDTNTWAEVRHSVANPNVVDAETDYGDGDLSGIVVTAGGDDNGKYYFAFPVPDARTRPGGIRRPKLVGPSHKLRIKQFSSLYSIIVEVVPELEDVA